MRRTGTTWPQLCKLAAGLAGVTIDTWYGTPALKVGGKGFVRLKEDAATVVFVVDGLDTRDALIATRPGLYFITEHYRAYPAVLARLRDLPAAEARERVEHAWLNRAGEAIITGGTSRQRAARPASRARSRSPRRR
jgi:hypothetical protein